jgi:uncharacterized membrane protein YdbT with pleckstrin-like domain
MIEVNKDEKIVRVVRKHWFILIGNLFILIACVAAPMIIAVALNYIPIHAIFNFYGGAGAAESFLLFAWLTFVWMVGWHMWTDYYLDVLIITDKRIFDIEQLGFFTRRSSSFHIDRLQDITVEQKGIIQTLLHFGAIRFETAGEAPNLVTPYVAHPYDVKKFINAMQDKHAERSQLVHFDAHMSGSHITAAQKKEE